jgi:hypothetical protein
VLSSFEAVSDLVVWLVLPRGVGHKIGPAYAGRVFGKNESGRFGSMVMVKVMKLVADKYGVNVLSTKDYGTYVKDFMLLPPWPRKSVTGNPG